ncbi:glycosyltransferase [Streptomyces sp. NPDC088785]|uniref:glycosyltransferase n=1 Tax=Streptomyces sp. NPDC088785 TaxID=3365897 RepID=UPI003810FF32
MRIALVHDFSGASVPGGENDAVRDQAAALTRAGHAVRLVTGGAGAPRELRAFAPDVVHVHQLSPAADRARAAAWPGPLVVTLHRHRPPRRDPLLRRADRAVVLSEPSRDGWLAAGMPPERLALIPDHVPPVPDPGPAQRTAWVCVGRLAVERGVLDLLRRWPARRRLDVVGTGPLERECRAAAPPSVRFLGVGGRDALRRSLTGYLGLVFPSRWHEGAVPLVYLEALAAGLPVLAFEGSALPRAVRAEGTGTVTAPDAPLPAALAAADRVFPTLREHCRAVHAKRYGEAAWVERAERLYAAVRAEHRSAEHRSGERR